MKQSKNKKIIFGITGFMLLVGVFFLTPKAAKAGNVLTVLNPFTDPLTGLVVADAFSCGVNVLWGCDSSGNPLPHASVSVSSDYVYVGKPAGVSWSVSGVTVCSTFDDMKSIWNGDITKPSGTTGFVPLYTGRYKYKILCGDGASKYYVSEAFLNVIAPAACGPANGTSFLSSSTGYGSSVQCSGGLSTNTEFPDIDSLITWKCLDDLGKYSPKCSASRVLASGCTLPGDGTPLADGASISAYATRTVTCGSTCDEQPVICNNGILSNMNPDGTPAVLSGHCEGADQRNADDCDADEGIWVYDTPLGQYKSCEPSCASAICTPKYQDYSCPLLTTAASCDETNAGQTIVTQQSFCSRSDVNGCSSDLLPTKADCADNGVTCSADITEKCPEPLQSDSWKEVTP